MKKELLLIAFILGFLTLSAQVQIDKDIELNGTSGNRDIIGAQTIDVSVGYLFGNSPGTSGQVLRSNGSTGFVAASIVASDLPDLSGSYIKNQTTQQTGANFNIAGAGVIGTALRIDNTNANSGTTASALTFGATGSGEGIGSKRTATGNQFGLDFYTGGLNRMAISNTGNVGIGTTSIGERLDVNGNILYRGIINSGGTVSTSTITTKRYYIESRLGTQNRTTVPIDHAVLVELCGDEDGCPVVIGMKNWGAGVSRSTSLNLHFFYNPATRQFRVSDFATREGTDNDNVLNHAIIHYDCYFTDTPYTTGVSGTDNQNGMYLLSWNDQYNVPDKTCWLRFED